MGVFNPESEFEINGAVTEFGEPADGFALGFFHDAVGRFGSSFSDFNNFVRV